MSDRQERCAMCLDSGGYCTTCCTAMLKDEHDHYLSENLMPESHDPDTCTFCPPT